MNKKKFEIGFVLSGGGARGFAHLGFLEAMNEAGIFPDVISGTSSGALAGVLYADGYSPKEILGFMNTGSRYDFMRPAIPRDGLLQINGIIKILRANLHAKSFNELKIPLYVTATDINNGKAVYFSEGELLEKVVASASIPVLYPPVKIGDFNYVDGGILDNFPVRPIENNCRLIIGSFVNQISYVEKVSGLRSITERTFMLSMSRDMYEKAKKFDLLVSPAGLGNYRILDTLKAEELFMVGYEATKEKLKEVDINKLIAEKEKI
jgi:NTE family protein